MQETAKAFQCGPPGYDYKVREEVNVLLDESSGEHGVGYVLSDPWRHIRNPPVVWVTLIKRRAKAEGGPWIPAQKRKDGRIVTRVRLCCDPSCLSPTGNKRLSARSNASAVLDRMVTAAYKKKKRTKRSKGAPRSRP